MPYSIYGESYQSTNAAGNQSTVYARITLVATNIGYSGYSTAFQVYVGGNLVANAGGPSALNTDGSGTETWTSGWYGYTYGHDTNGYRGDVGTSVAFQGSGGFSPPSMSTGGPTQGAINYDRKPAAVTGTTAVVNADKSITVSFAGGASPGGTPTLTSTYRVSYSQNGGAFTGEFTGASSPITIPTGTLTPGNNYVFRAWATNESNDGASASSDSASVFLSSGGRIYNGTAWVPTVTARIYNGTAWVPIVTARVYNGTSWVNLT